MACQTLEEDAFWNLQVFDSTNLEAPNVNRITYGNWTARRLSRSVSVGYVSVIVIGTGGTGQPHPRGVAGVNPISTETAPGRL